MKLSMPTYDPANAGFVVVGDAVWVTLDPSHLGPGVVVRDMGGVVVVRLEVDWGAYFLGYYVTVRECEVEVARGAVRKVEPGGVA